MELTQSEDDRTVMTPSGGAPTDGRVLQATGDNALPVGTVLGEFEITGLIGEGGFGIVYLAYDHSLQRKVALKEYMPSGLASRKSGVTVAKSQQHLETFQAGLRSFINEARLLAQFDHPSLVKVHRFWEANGTAYMVMPFYDAITLRDTLHERGVPPDEIWLKQLLKHLLDALEVIHQENCFHRDIAPDNILILKDGRPLLLDFGAARRVISDMTQNLTVILKPGYAPIEQYAEMNSMKQGAWTDIYALAAVVYYAVTGKAPIPAVARIISDSLEPLAGLEHGRERYAPEFLHAIDRALAVKPEARPQSVAEFRGLLGLASATPSSEVELSHFAEPTPRHAVAIAPAGLPEATRRETGPHPALYGFGVVLLLALLAGGWFFAREGTRATPEPVASGKEITATPAPSDDQRPLGKAQGELSAGSASTAEFREPLGPGPVTTHVLPETPPEIQQHATEKLAEPPRQKPDRRVAKRAGAGTETSGMPSAADQITKKHGPIASPIQKIIETNLNEARACLNNKNFECAIAKGETVLQLEPDNPVAGALLKDARAAQQKAWEASELK